MHCGVSLALPFLLSLILPGRRRTLNLQTITCGRCPQASRYAPAVSSQPGHLVGLACLARCVMHVFTARLAFSLCGLPFFDFSVQVVLSQHGGHRLHNPGCPVALARPQTHKALGLNPVYCVIVSNTSSVA